MRLGQLARKLNKSTQELVDYLKSEGLSVNEHPNSKFPEEFETKVILHFGGEVETVVEESIDEPASEPKSDALEVVSDDQPEIIEAKTTVDEPALAQETSSGMDEPIEGHDTEVEVIKAPKIELPGLKVVGKIELPQPKSKPVGENDGNTDGESDLRFNRRGNRYDKKRLTPEEREERRLKYKAKQKEKDEWELHKKKLREERQRKAKRTAYYETNVQPKSSTKPVKKTRNKKVSSNEETDNRPKPKTIIGKIWRWLNT